MCLPWRASFYQRTSHQTTVTPLSVGVTMNMYTKVVTALKRDAADRIDELVNDVDR
jgi:hypothetical protein